MAWPAPKRCTVFVSLLIWCGIQTLFFIPQGWPHQTFTFILKSNQGDFRIFQDQREAIIVGAFSDRYQRFPRMELVPFLRKKGIRRINKLILTGHDQSQTGALPELQKNFIIADIFYPPDSAERMRKTFNQIERSMQLKRLLPEILEKRDSWEIECLSAGEKGVNLKIKGGVGS